MREHALLPNPAASGEGSRVADLKAWIASQFEAAGKEAPAFELTPGTAAHLQAIATASQARTRASTIVAADFRQKAAEYRSQGKGFPLFRNCSTSFPSDKSLFALPLFTSFPSDKLSFAFPLFVYATLFWCFQNK